MISSTFITVSVFKVVFKFQPSSTHSFQIFPSYTLWKYQKTWDFMFPGGKLGKNGLSSFQANVSLKFHIFFAVAAQ